MEFKFKRGDMVVTKVGMEMCKASAMNGEPNLPIIMQVLSQIHSKDEGSLPGTRLFT
jgi:hypothetical protein